MSSDIFVILIGLIIVAIIITAVIIKHITVENNKEEAKKFLNGLSDEILNTMITIISQFDPNLYPNAEAFEKDVLKRIYEVTWDYSSNKCLEAYNENNIFSINYKYFEFIDLKSEAFSHKTPDKIYDFEVKKYKSYRNSLIKLTNGNYLLNIILSYGVFNVCYLYITSFNFNSNSMDYFNEVKTYYQKIDYQNSTSCFQTESSYIQCSYNKLLATDDLFTVGISFKFCIHSSIVYLSILFEQRIASFIFSKFSSVIFSPLTTVLLS